MMGGPMTDGEGERLERTRRRKFWSVLGWVFVAGLVAGGVFGFVEGHHGAEFGDSLRAAPDAVVIAMLAAAIAAFTYGCWVFARAIDEVELADNLWGSTASYYAYAILFPAWWVLSKAQIAPPPDHWLIFFVSLGAGLAVYFWRKWRAR